MSYKKEIFLALFAITCSIILYNSATLDTETTNENLQI